MAWENAPYQPRDWQRLALPIILAKIRAGVRSLVVAATGSGKAVEIAEVIAELLAELDGVVVVTVPTRRLVQQLAAPPEDGDEGGTLVRRLGVEVVGRFFADAKELDRRVVVCCNNSAPRLAELLDGRPVALWIPDEAHRTEAEDLRVTFGAIAPRWVCGFTATPFRASDREKLRFFDEVVYRHTLMDALSAGDVVPWRVIPWVGKEARPLTALLLELIEQHTTGPGAVNARTIAEAEHIAALLTWAGVPAAAVHSRLPEEEQERRLAALRAGVLRAVTYPSLLGEGVDLPWLHWLALARPVRSVVRFIQEFGRVLRTHPGKTEAVILDPHGLVERFDLLRAEALGLVDEEPGGDGAGGLGVDGGEGGAGGEGSAAFQDYNLEPLDALTHWAAHLVIAAQADKLLSLRLKLRESERAKGATPGQIAALKKMRFACRWLPGGHAELARQIVTGSLLPTAGAASDLMDVLMALAGHREVWTPRLQVWLPPVAIEEAAAALEVGTLAAAGLVYREQRAVVVVLGRRVLHSHVRPAREGEGATSASIEAVLVAAGLRPGLSIHTHDAIACRFLAGKVRAQRPDIVAVLARRPATLPPVVLVETTEAKALAFRSAAGAAYKAARKNGGRP